MQPLFDWINNNALDILITLLVTAFFYYVGGKLLASFIRHIVHAKGRHWSKEDITKRQDTLSGLVSAVWQVLVITVAFFSLFALFFPSINLGPVFASAGILGVALGFGAQSLVKDFLSGLFIVIENQYRVGDVVELDGEYGTIERIGTRSTSMRDMYGNLHYIPNGMIGHTINLTNQYSLTRFDLKVSPEADIEKAIDIINIVGKQLAESAEWKRYIIEAPHFLRLGEIDALSTTMTIDGKVEAAYQWSIIAEMRRGILSEFKKHKISLAYPIPPGLIHSDN